jgi:hypothetical protein
MKSPMSGWERSNGCAGPQKALTGLPLSEQLFWMEDCQPGTSAQPDPQSLSTPVIQLVGKFAQSFLILDQLLKNV